jgi:glycosyltransferase involved in cell wall biosynthesis
MTKLGVIVPCRDEAAVIERKILNLARCEWPAAGAPHEVVIVDDGSSDGTAERARAAIASLARGRVRWRVIANELHPGKAGAIRAGSRALGESVDVVVLTDADVGVAPDAPAELARAFERRPRLAMATGAQRFVRELPSDGSTSALAPDDSLYDTAANLVRAVESRAGRVFSVQGQWMAWRASLALEPALGIAADDLDLMLQVRCRGGEIRRIASSRFFETRSEPGERREQQAVRRARAFVQFQRHPRIDELLASGSWLARAQARAYLRARRVGEAWFALPFAALLLASPWLPVAATASALVLLALTLLPAWTLARGVAARIDAARASEAERPASDRWETARR